MRATTPGGIGLFVLMILFATPVFADSTFLKFGSSWKYHEDGSAPAPDWKEGAFNDQHWLSGKSAFGYGNGYQRTLINQGSNRESKTITTYFRSSVNIVHSADYSYFRTNLYLDDGAVIYVNGREAGRLFMPGGAIQNSTLASTAIADNGNVMSTLMIKSTFFKDGSNDIAVEVHQNNRMSRSMVFDLELIGISGSNPSQITRGPLLQMVNGSGITVKWKTNLPSNSAVRYGLDEAALTGLESSDAQVTDHELTIKGLKADTKYYYAIGTTASMMKGSYRNSFLTSPPANTTRKIRIGVIGDAGTGDVNQKRSRDRYLEQYHDGISPDLAIMLGDNAYPLGTDKDHQSAFFNIYDDNLFNNHAVFSVPGNHEYAGVAGISDIAYYNVFTLPKAGESGGTPSGTESYYSFDYGNIHFVMLNSYGLDGGKVLYDTSGPQALWLKSDLRANAGKSRWTIACFHHPPYSNANHSSDAEGDLTAIRERITPILERFGVDMVLSGHSHGYERSYLVQHHTGKSGTFIPAPAPAGNLVNGSSAKYDGSDNSCPYIIMDTTAAHGTMYIVAGAAGQLGGGNNAKLPLFYFRNFSATPGAETGLLYLEIQHNRLDGKYIGANTGAILDRFTLMKGVGMKKNIIAEVNTPVKLSASWNGNYKWSSTDPTIKTATRTVTVTPTTSSTFTYYVRDNEQESMSCITDTFIVRSYASVLNSNVDFTAVQKQNIVLLKWMTEQDMTTATFELERSGNGVDYTKIGTLPLAVSSAPALHYAYEDPFPLQGKNYYKLVQITVSGRRTELGVRMVDFRANYSITVRTRVNPSPSGKVEILIDNSRTQNLDLSIVDLKGIAVYSKEMTLPAGKQSIKLNLLPGAYVISGKTMDGPIPSVRLMVN